MVESLEKGFTNTMTNHGLSLNLDKESSEKMLEEIRVKIVMLNNIKLLGKIKIAASACQNSLRYFLNQSCDFVEVSNVRVYTDGKLTFVKAFFPRTQLMSKLLF